MRKKEEEAEESLETSGQQEDTRARTLKPQLSPSTQQTKKKKTRKEGERRYCDDTVKPQQAASRLRGVRPPPAIASRARVAVNAAHKVPASCRSYPVCPRSRQFAIKRGSSDVEFLDPRFRVREREALRGGGGGRMDGGVDGDAVGGFVTFVIVEFPVVLLEEGIGSRLGNQFNVTERLKEPVAITEPTQSSDQSSNRRVLALEGNAA